MNLVDRIKLEVLNNPGITLPRLADTIKECSRASIAAALTRLSAKNQILKKGVCGHYEYYPTKSAALANAVVSETFKKQANPFVSFTPRELLEELKRRGYVWDKMWVETRQYVEYGKI